MAIIGEDDLGKSIKHHWRGKHKKNEDDYPGIDPVWEEEILPEFFQQIPPGHEIQTHQGCNHGSDRKTEASYADGHGNPLNCKRTFRQLMADDLTGCIELPAQYR